MSTSVGIQFARHQRSMVSYSWLLLVPMLISFSRAEEQQPLVAGPIPRVRLRVEQADEPTPRPIQAWLTSLSASQVQPVPLSMTRPAPLDVPPGGMSWSTPEGDAAAQSSLVLDGRSIACRSAQNWIPADLLRSRARTIQRLYCDEKDECARQAAAAMSKFLHMQASHQEDIGAASALRAYYTRIALAEKLALTSDTLQLISEEESKQIALQSRGLAAATDMSSFDRNRFEVTDNQLLITTQDRRLRCVLSELTGVDYEMSSILQEQLEVYRCALDVPGLKQIALQQRKDYRSWIYLSRNVNATSAPEFAKMLPTLIGGWSLPLPTIFGLKQLLCPPDYSQLAADMCRELQLTIETHRRWISQAVEEKGSNVNLGYDRIDLAQQAVASWRARIEQLRELEEQGAPRPQELAEARTALLRARGEEIDRRLETRTAEIDLAEAVGCISDRCCAGQAWLLTGLE